MRPKLTGRLYVTLQERCVVEYAMVGLVHPLKLLLDLANEWFQGRVGRWGGWGVGVEWGGGELVPW